MIALLVVCLAVSLLQGASVVRPPRIARVKVRIGRPPATT